MKTKFAALGVLAAFPVLAFAQRLAPSDLARAEAAMKTTHAAAIRAHMAFLSDGLLEGRAPGTRGYDVAARYIASQLEGMNLEPAGEKGTWFQSVPIRKAIIDASKSSIVLLKDGKEQQLVDAVDYVFFADGLREESSIEAPLFFAGFGVTAPEFKYDDYAGADVRGKIVVTISGAPPRLPSTERAYYSEGTVKAENAVAHGAVGIVAIALADDAKRNPWTWVVPQVQMGQMRWLDSKQTPRPTFPELLAGVLFSPRGAEILFTGASKTLDEIAAAAHASTPQSFSLPWSARIHTISRHTDLRSSNIIGKISGSDSALRNQYVVYTAHVDHIGVCPPISGDNICHGAWDNASGMATLLEIARAFTSLPQAPRRSILFLFVTGEEIGFLGSGYFTNFPTVPLNEIVADINIDGAPGLLGAKKDMVDYSAGHSTLDKAFELAARQAGYEISPDPMPEQTLFVRSDQYSFVLQGVPVVFVNDGMTAADPSVNGREVFMKYLTTQYHTPLDNMNQVFDYESAVKGSRLNFLLGFEVAEEEQPPVWNAGDFFGVKFGPKRMGRTAGTR